MYRFLQGQQKYHLEPEHIDDIRNKKNHAYSWFWESKTLDIEGRVYIRYTLESLDSAKAQDDDDLERRQRQTRIKLCFMTQVDKI